MQWPDGWEQIAPDERLALEAELEREVGRGHSLYSCPVEAIARRHDCDDVLFAVAGTSTVAVVHLSYSKADVLWPQTQTFSSLEAWMEQRQP